MTEQPTFAADLHKKYVHSLDIEKPERFEYWVTEHLRVSGIYWGFVAMSMMNSLEEMDLEKASSFVLSCQRDGGGFGGHVVHDAHIVTTYNAIQVLAMAGQLDKVDPDKVATCMLLNLVLIYFEGIAGLQNEDGSFSGDEWGEIDTR
jgi:geranylgeranyl transferase type-2 subunit beta